MNSPKCLQQPLAMQESTLMPGERSFDLVAQELPLHWLQPLGIHRRPNWPEVPRDRRPAPSSSKD